MNETILYQLVSPSGKRYVGITDNFNQRMKQHSQTKHQHLSNEIENYSFDNFTIIKTSYSNRVKAQKTESDLIRRYKESGISLNGNNAYSVISLQISKDLKADVKIKCAKEGKTIREVVEQLLTEWVKK